MLDFETDYPQWREAKLSSNCSPASESVITIEQPERLAKAELEALYEQCFAQNFAIYRLVDPKSADKTNIKALATQLGMHQLDNNLCADNDSISSLQVMQLGRARGYIPYTANALNWHTDGYYNNMQQHIRSFLLHCVQNAVSGGKNMFINHELIYIQLHDEDPAMISALCQQDAMTIPANVEDGIEIRAAKTGPVFYRDAITGTLQMRYTARSKSIQWKDNKDLDRALNRIESLLSDNDFVQHYTLQPGEGFICNNILHGRSAFTNGNIPQQQRLMYRARSYNRLFSASE